MSSKNAQGQTKTQYFVDDQSCASKKRYSTNGTIPSLSIISPVYNIHPILGTIVIDMYHFIIRRKFEVDDLEFALFHFIIHFKAFIVDFNIEHKKFFTK